MKKNLKRISASLLLAALLASCGAESTSSAGTQAVQPENPPADTETEAVTEELFEKDSLPADLDLGGETVKLLIGTTWEDEFYAEKETGDIVNDAMYRANRNIEERLNMTLDYLRIDTSWDVREEYKKQVGALIMADTDDFDLLISASYMCEFFVQNYLLNLTGLPYLDFSKPWWSSKMAENIRRSDVLPFMTGDISLGMIRSMMCMFFNKQLCTDYDIEDLYACVLDGRWTVEKLESLAKLVYEDLNGDSKVDDSDRFGVVLEGNNYATGFYEACKIETFTEDSGQLVFSLDNEHNTAVIDRLWNLFHTNSGAFIRGKDDSTYYRADDALFKNGNVLLTGGWIKCAESYRELPFDYGIIPYPKFDEAQENYRTTVLTTWRNAAIPVSCKRVEAACAVMEAMASEYYRTLTPAYFETALKVKYSRDNETAQMFDLIRESTGFSLGLCFTNAFGNTDVLFKDAINGQNPTWASTVASKRKQIETKLLPAVLAAYEAAAES